MRVLSIYISFLILIASCTFASDDAGTESPFSMGAGARELALGGSNLAFGDIATAPYWNPSRLAQAERITLGGFYSRLYDSDVSYQYLGCVIPTLSYGSFGLGVFRLGIGGIEKRDANNLMLGHIQDERLRFNLAYGVTFSRYNFGLALNLEHHSLDKYTATSSPGVNLSISRQYLTNLDWLSQFSIALVGRNLVKTSSKLANENISYPISGDLGFAITLLPKPSWNHSLTLTTKLTKVDKIKPTFAAGLEYGFSRFFYLRGGLNNTKLSLGGGLSYKSLSFDYAFVNRDLDNLHMFNVTLFLGTSITEKRQLRVQKQEKKFNSMMNEQLSANNNSIVNELVSKGKEFIKTDNLNDAEYYFDRALFLARINSIDTTKIYQLATDTKSRLLEITRRQNFQQYYDSAQVKFKIQDYLGARYYGNLALSEYPDSKETSDLLKQLDDIIQRNASREEMIQNHLLLVDSLLSYGDLDQAYITVQTVKRFDENDKRVNSALKKVKFERYREAASKAYSEANFDLATANIDSALVLFPQHQICLELRNRINRHLENSHTNITKNNEAKPKLLSEALNREVKESYKSGQDFFEQGKLQQAVNEWEQVERLAPNYEAVRKYLVNAYNFVGVELYSQNQFKEAIDTWEKARKIDPGNVEVKEYIKRTKNELRRLNELSNNSN